MNWNDGRLRSGALTLARLVPPDRSAPIDSPRPVIHPVLTPGGIPVTESSPPDHSWHRGLSLAISNIAVEGESMPVNLWGGVTFTGNGYEQLDNNGSQVVVSERTTGPAWTATLDWRTAGGRTFAREQRAVGAQLQPGRLLLRWSSAVENATGGVLRFGSPTTAGRPRAGYGGLFLRGSSALVGAEVALEGVGAVDADAAMGTAARWAALRSSSATVAIGTEDASLPWFVRSTPHALLCSAPFFETEVPLDPGARVSWSWRVLVADGALDDAEIASRLVSGAAS